MKIYFIFLILFFSCNSLSDHKNCEMIAKIKVYSIGFPNLTFSIKQIEEDVRRNPQRSIINSARIEKIKKLIQNLDICKSDNRTLGSIMGVCDVYCEKGSKYTLLYDKFYFKINDTFYCKDDILVNELFGDKR